MNEDTHRQEYLNERQFYIEGSLASQRDFDKSLITLCTGVLGLSIAMTRLFDVSLKAKFCPIGCWIFLTLSLIFILISFDIGSRYN